MNLIRTKNVHLNDKQQSDIMEYLKVIFYFILSKLILKRDRFLKRKPAKKYLTITKSMLCYVKQVIAFAEQYKWWPAPWFTIFTTIILIASYAYQVITRIQDETDYLQPQCSHLVFSPYRHSSIYVVNVGTQKKPAEAKTA